MVRKEIKNSDRQTKSIQVRVLRQRSHHECAPLKAPVTAVGARASQFEGARLSAHSFLVSLDTSCNRCDAADRPDAAVAAAGVAMWRCG